VNGFDMSEKAKIENVIILGTGPAGLAAALYTARADLQPLVLTGTDLGGQAALTDRIENYPGFPQGVGGCELADLFQKTAERFGARVEFETALSVDLSGSPFKVFTYEKEYLARAIIIATGASPNNLNIPGEKEFRAKGVSYCATCDGTFFKDKKVAVVGGGDSALEEAIFLTRFSSSVTIIHRRNELRAGVLLQKRARENSKIHFLFNSIVEEIKGQDSVNSILIKNTETDEKSVLIVDGVFIFIGHTPNTQLFKDFLDLDNNGYLVVDQRMRTKIPVIFAAGEVADGLYRQVVTSAGMGAAAGIEATRFLGNC
jgi:thioredoxin reductase (NADPH)